MIKDHIWTDESFDRSFAENSLGNWLWTLMLLKSTSICMDRDSGRAIVIGSDTADSHDEMNSYVGQ
jgi:hypothetical protein